MTSSPNTAASLDGQLDTVKHDKISEALADPVDLDCITRGPSLARAARRCAGPRGGS
jgi:hypothetical protein